MRLKTKLIAFCLGIGLLPVAVMGTYSVHVASRSLSDQAFRQLEAVRDAKRYALNELLRHWKQELRIYAASKEVYNALGMLRDAAMGVKDGQRIDPADSEYKDTLDYLAPPFAPFVEKLGFEDALLIGDHGRIFFSHARGRDLGEDLANGSLLKNSLLRSAWERALKGEFVFTDVEPYAALDNRPAAFVVGPVYDHVGVIEGAAALRLPLAEINALMNLRDGMGATGETYLVGPDAHMRSNSFREPTAHILGGPGTVDTNAAHSALAGGTHTAVITDFRGVRVLSASAPLALDNTTWAFIAEIDAREAFAPVRELRTAALLLGLATALLVLANAILFVRWEIVTPLDAIGRFLTTITHGDMTVALDGKFKAEMARLADGVNAMFHEIKSRLGFAQGVLGGITFPCLVLDTEARITYANRHMMELMEKTEAPEHYLGQTVGEFFTGVADAATTSTRALGEERQVRAERQLRTAKGTALTASVNATPIYDLDGQLMGVFTLYFDLTHIRAQEGMIRTQNEKIARVATEASDIADHVTGAAAELSQQTDEILRGARIQTDRTTDTASAMHQITTAMAEVAGNASRAADNAEHAKNKAAQGDAIVRDAMRAIAQVHGHAASLSGNMDELGKQAHEVGKIITVINDIADQTNLLALNAAIEAARAGDAGRGFAVVADEVRKLAEKTVHATREVSGVIANIRSATDRSMQSTHDAVQAVKESSQLAGASGEALREIVNMVDDTAMQVRAMAAANCQQASASEAVSASVEEISRISRTTTVSMDASAEAIIGLSATANQLQALIADMLA